MNQLLAHGLGNLFLFESIRPVFTVPEIVEPLCSSLSKAYRLIRTPLHYGLLERKNGGSKSICRKSIPIQKGVQNGGQLEGQIAGQFVRFDP